MNFVSSIQIRKVPEDVRQILKSRAAASGRSLSEYLREILTREARHPTIDEFVERLRLRGHSDVGTAGVEILRAERENTH